MKQLGIHGFVSLLLLNSLSYAGSQCPSPKTGYPSISFGMTEISGNNCKTQLDRARWLGFTTVSLSPTFYFNADGTVTPRAVPGELESCLTYANGLGFDIIYKPMIEAGPNTPPASFMPPPGHQTLADSLMAIPDMTHAPWRAYFNFDPRTDYQTKVLEPFFRWLEVNPIKGTSLKVAVVVATELHRSLTDYPQDWNSLIWNLQQRLIADGLRGQVQVGLDPTVFGQDPWLPEYLKRHLSIAECDQIQLMLWSADFYSASIYGNYMAGGFATNPAKSVENLYSTSEKSWEKALTSRGCKLDPSLTNRYRSGDYTHRDKGRTTRVAWPGEMGYAGNLTASWSAWKTQPPYSSGQAAMNQYRKTTLVKEQQDFIHEAPIWVKGILDSAREMDQDNLSFWITGRYDIFGFSSLPPLGELDSYQGEYTDADPVKGPDAIPAVAALRDLLRSYTQERCTGWQAALPNPVF